MIFYTSLVLTFLALGALRLYAILPSSGTYRRPRPKRTPDTTCKLSVFLGSGGHTSEALAMISGLDFRRYQPRDYFVSEGDTLSAQKAVALEEAVALRNSKHSEVSKPYRIVVIPRARRVHQPLLTTPISAFISLLSCIYYMSVEPLMSSNRSTSAFPDVLVLNGPGTCLMLCIAIYFNKFLALPSPAIIYVESFARVQSLSLSGKLIRPLVDRFIVQWPQLLQKVPKGEYHEWLV